MKKNKTISVKICVCIICAFSLLLSADRSKIAASAEETGEINTETAANSSEAETDTASRDSVTISLAGDCSLGKLSIHSYAGSFYEMYDLYGASCFFQNVKDIFEQDDMTLVNFEGVLTTSNQSSKKEFNIKGKPEFNQILIEGNIDAVSFGNNHNMDYGAQSKLDTIAAFQEINLPYACDDTVGIFETAQGIRIGFISVNEVYDGAKVEIFLENGIAELKNQEVDLILACCHWGEELEHYPEAYQTDLGHKCIDWGADLVVGCHPHVLQGIENYNGKYIIYSLGNFCFGGNKNPKDKNSMIVQAVFPLVDGTVSGDAELKIIPCTISSVTTRNDYCPTVADKEKAADIIQKMNAYSEQFGVMIDAAGGIYSSPTAGSSDSLP